MGILAFAAALVALYLLLGLRSYRARRSDSGRTHAEFALRELGGGVRIAAAWLLWPFVSWPERESDR